MSLNSVRMPAVGVRSEEPCPFCGNDGCRVVKEVEHDMPYYFVICPSCGAKGPEVARKWTVDEFSSVVEAIRRWESRWMMTIDEAIAHCDEKASCDGPCASDHA